MKRALLYGTVTAALCTLCACASHEGTPSHHDATVGGDGNAGMIGNQSLGGGGSNGGVGSGGGGTGGATAGRGGGGRAGAPALGTPGGSSALGAPGGAGAGGIAGTAGAGLGAMAGGGAGGGLSGGGRAGAAAGAPSTADCTGTFGNAQVLVAGAKQVILSSPTVPEDELELFFVQHDMTKSDGPRILRAVRATTDAAFGDPADVAELDSVCSDTQERGISLTPDGLRLYVDCYTGTSTFTPGPVHLASRASRDASFALDQTTYGTVGPQIDVTTDELTAFTSSETNSTSPPREYSRSGTDQPFANGQAVAGLENVAVATPFLASDGLTLFGSMDVNLVATVRPAPAEPFGSPSVIFMGQSNMVSFKAPEVSADCRTLYFVRIDTASGASTYSLEVATR